MPGLWTIATRVDRTEVGYDAVMITDTAFYRNPNYHTPRDTAETLDYQRMAEVVQGVYAAVLALAQ